MNVRTNKPKHTTAFHFKVHTPNLYTEDTSNLDLIQDHADIVQAKTNREGILERLDYKGENTNETIRVKENDKHEKEEPSEDEKEDEVDKYKPGERLLMMIMQERPELLYKPERERKVVNRKRITTKRKTKLKKISDTLQNR